MPYFRQQEIINAGAYMRISREDAGICESNSILNQRQLLSDFITSHGMTMVDEYIDDGYTGTNFDRPAFRTLIEDCKSKKINCIVVKDLSRLGRNATMAGRYIDEIFPRLGIRFIAVTDNYDSNDTLYTGLDLMTPFKNLCNEMYARDISKKIRAVNEVAIKKGEYLGGHPPYGYLRDPENKHHLIVDEQAAPIVRIIFDLKMMGQSSMSIAKLLNASGVETPLQRLKRVTGSTYRFTDDEIKYSLWKARQITHMLQNEVYTGTIVSKKTGRPNYKIHKQKANDKSLWVRVPGKHEPIVSKEIFDYTQDLFMRLQSSTILGIVRPLAGFLRCPDCGMVMVHTGSPNTQKEYYNCSSYMRKEGCCSHHIRMKKVENYVLGEMRMLIEYLIRAKKQMEKQGLTSYRDDTIEELNRQIEKEVAEEHRYSALKTHLLEDKVNGLIDTTTYEEMNRYFADLLKLTEERIVNLQKEQTKIKSEQMSLMPWIDSIMEFRGANELMRKAVIMMIDYIYIHKDKSIEIRFRHHDEIQDLLKTIKGGKET